MKPTQIDIQNALRVLTHAMSPHIHLAFGNGDLVEVHHVQTGAVEFVRTQDLAEDIHKGVLT